jgi:hypothetical protein
MESRLAQILMVGLLGPPSLAAGDVEASWNRAVELAGRNARWVPGTILEREVVFNRDGEVEEITERHIRIERDAEGSLEMVLARAAVNGKDVTARERQAFDDAAKAEYAAEAPQEEPFSPSRQESVRLQGPAQRERLEDTVCERVGYEQTTDDGEWIGEAWLAASTGAPLQLRFRTDRTFKEDGATISSLAGRILYHHGGPEAWYPREVRYSMDIEARVFPLVRFRGRVETTLTLTDYFRLD